MITLEGMLAGALAWIVLTALAKCVGAFIRGEVEDFREMGARKWFRQVGQAAIILAGLLLTGVALTLVAAILGIF